MSKRVERLELAHELLSHPKNEGDRAIITYYSKPIIIPEVGDIIIVNYANFDQYYFIILEVEQNLSKLGLKYLGVILAQKGYEYGMAPQQIKSRDDLEIRDKETKIVQIYPKDRSKIMSITISNL